MGRLNFGVSKSVPCRDGQGVHCTTNLQFSVRVSRKHNALKCKPPGYTQICILRSVEYMYSDDHGYNQHSASQESPSPFGSADGVS